MTKFSSTLVALTVLASACSFATSGTAAPQPTYSFEAPPDRGADSGSEVVTPVGGEQALSKEMAFKNLGQVGTAASGILRSDPFRRIILEVDWVRGREPRDAAIALLAQRIHEVTGKEVLLEGGNEIPEGSGSYYPGEIREMSKNRAVSEDRDAITIWIGYLNGGAAARDDAVGGSVSATVIAIFPDKINGYVTEGIDGLAIESSTLVHEFGHLMGLVNIGYRSPRNREDPEHPGHSNNPDSVMHWGVKRFQLDGKLPPTGFDADDLADLKDLAEGKL